MRIVVFMLMAMSAIAGAAVFDVRQFGARGDGQSNDQTPIQAAADAAARAGGGIVSFPAGTWAHNDVIALGSNVTVQGAGAETVLLSTNPHRAALSFTDAGGCSIRSIKVEGAHSPRLSNDESADILLRNSHDCRLADIWIDGSASVGIIVHASVNIVVDHVEVRNTNSDGVHVVSGSRHVTVSNSVGINTGDDSFSAVAYAAQPQTMDVTFEHDKSTKSRARGITCIGAKGCVIANSSVVDSSAHGIAVAYEKSYDTWHPEDAQVRDVEISNVTSPGMNPILINGARRVGLRTTAVHASNPVYVNTCSEVTIEGLQVFDARGPSVLVRQTSLIDILNSSIERAAGAGIKLDGVMEARLQSNRIADVQMTSDSNRGAIDIENSQNVSGTENTVKYSPAWHGTSFGTIRATRSTGVRVIAIKGY